MTELQQRKWRDIVAFYLVKSLRIPVDLFFRKRYGHRAVILETVAGVPGMVGAMLHHLKSLRTCKTDNGLIKTLLEEAENERMHLMVFIEIAQPNFFEKLIIIGTQILFFLCYAFLYIISPRTAHRVVGYLEDEAVTSYTSYLREIDNGAIENIPAPKIAITYWNLPKTARLRELVIAVRQDEMNHRDCNHKLANNI